jgi:uncharacterized damage-inducible protein DinB
MSPTDLYADLFAHEKAATAQMLGMLHSVPPEARSDPRYGQAVDIAHHVAACRENWLDRITGAGLLQVEWWARGCDPSALGARFAAVEARWEEFFRLGGELDRDVTFPLQDGRRFCWNVEGQLRSLAGHANYHRGQVALLVDQLGGQTVDTDYLFWKREQDPDRWGFR